MIPLLLLVVAMAVVFGIGSVAGWLFAMAAVLLAVSVMEMFLGRRRSSHWR
jgi:hypothetical protein